MGAHGSKSDKIPPEQLSELIQLTHFEKKELKKCYQGFIKDCPDRTMDQGKFIELYSRFYSHGNAAKFATHVFRTFDYNNDGSIDFGEFVTSLSVTTRGSIEEKLKWAFQIYDIDGNGYISQSELFSILKAVEKMAGAINEEAFSKSRVMNIFNKMDVNHDDKLSMEEFLTGAQEDESLVKLLTTCK